MELLASSPALFIGTCLVLGLLVGSFLNVVIARVPAGESVISPRSRCPRCEAPIAALDNIPVLSWLLLRREACLIQQVNRGGRDDREPGTRTDRRGGGAPPRTLAVTTGTGHFRFIDATSGERKSLVGPEK